MDNKNTIPRDKNGQKLKMGQMVVAEISEDSSQKKIKRRVEKQDLFLNLGPRRVYAKLIIVGLRKSTIQPTIRLKGEVLEGVKNDKITIVA